MSGREFLPDPGLQLAQDTVSLLLFLKRNIFMIGRCDAELDRISSL